MKRLRSALRWIRKAWPASTRSRVSDSVNRTTVRRVPLLPAVLVLGLCGALALYSSGRARLNQPAQVARQYAQAIIANDINTIGRLGGMDPSRGTPLETFWGKANAAAAAALAQSHAYDPANYQFQARTLEQTDSAATVQLDIRVKDIDTVVDQAMQVVGYHYSADGRLLPPEHNRMPFSEAMKRVEADHKVPPLHYRVGLHLDQRQGRWVIRYDRDSSSLISLLRQTTLSEGHERYLMRP